MEPLIQKEKNKKIWVGDVAVGGDAPISVQSMTNTETTDVEATVKQINDLEEAGADIVRVSVPSMEAAEAFKNIKQLTNIPLVSDIHFDHKIALKVMEYGVDCVRINPGNIGLRRKLKKSLMLLKTKIYLKSRGQCGLTGKRSSAKVWRTKLRCIS